MYRVDKGWGKDEKGVTPLAFSFEICRFNKLPSNLKEIHHEPHKSPTLFSPPVLVVVVWYQMHLMRWPGNFSPTIFPTPPPLPPPPYLKNDMMDPPLKF